MPVNQRIERWLALQSAATRPTRRPFVTLSYAQSWDGSITTRRGESLGLSGGESLRLTHQLRSLHDGILVGIGTVLADDPQLTVREWRGANPQPIVLDSQLRMPPGARLCQRADKTCWVLTRYSGHQPFAGNAEIIAMDRGDDGRVDLAEALQVLWQKGIRTLMVEGGSRIITAFLRAQLADALVLTVAPTLVGGLKGVGDLNPCSGRLPRIKPWHSQMLGDDLVMWGALQYRDALA